MQQVLQRDAVGATPFELTAVGTVVRPDRHADAVRDQVAQQAVDAAVPLELVEQQADHALHLLVGVQGERARRQLDVAGGRVVEHLAAARLVQQALVHPRAQDVQLRFAHGALEPQQQPVVVIGRVVQPVLVGQQGPEDGAQLQELMPVLVGAGQAAHLQAEDNADVVQADLGEQVLEAEPALGRLPAPPLVLVDDLDTVLGPAQRGGPVHQAVLPVRRLAVVEHLLGRRLPDVDDRLPLQVPGPDLG